MTSTVGFASCVMQRAPAPTGMQDKLWSSAVHRVCDVASVSLALYSSMRCNFTSSGSTLGIQYDGSVHLHRQVLLPAL